MFVFSPEQDLNLELKYDKLIFINEAKILKITLNENSQKCSWILLADIFSIYPEGNSHNKDNVKSCIWGLIWKLKEIHIEYFYLHRVG